MCKWRPHAQLANVQMATTRSKSGSAKSTNTRLKSSSSNNLSSEDANIDMISLSFVKELLTVQESSALKALCQYTWIIRISY